MSPPSFQRITVAVDGSAHALDALDVAIDLSLRYRAQLTVLAVAPLQPVFVALNEPFVAPSVQVSDMPRYQRIVEDAVARAEKAGVTAVTGVAEDGVVADELLIFLEDHPTDLLVIGSRGLSAAKRLLLGSISTAMVANAPCPVLVVRTPLTKPAP